MFRNSPLRGLVSLNGADSNGGRGGHTKCMGGASIAALRGTPIAAVYGAQLSLQSENAGYGTQTPAHDLALKKKREDATKSQPRASPCGQTPGPRLIHYARWDAVWHSSAGTQPSSPANTATLGHGPGSELRAEVALQAIRQTGPLKFVESSMATDGTHGLPPIWQHSSRRRIIEY